MDLSNSQVCVLVITETQNVPLTSCLGDHFKIQMQKTQNILKIVKGSNFSQMMSMQVMGTAMLMVGILAIIDSKNKPVPKGLEPVVVGMLVFSIGLSMGANCGYPINPSRDLGPRLFTYVAGWGSDVFRLVANPSAVCWL